MALILIGLIIVFGIFANNFFTLKNLMNILTQNAYFIVATIGVAIIMMSGGTDLSSGQMMGVIGVCMGIMMINMELPIPVAILAGILIGILLGAFNGFAANYLQIHPLIVTLATMTIFKGISFTLSQSKTFFGFGSAYKAIGQNSLFGWLPVPVLIAIIVAVVIHLMLEKTCFGRFIYAVGAPGSDAARLAGINVRRVKITVFMIAGFLYALACIMQTARGDSASSNIGPGVEFDAITACVLGGVSFIGGEGKVKGAVIGCLILGVLSNGMQLIGMGTYAQNIVKGFILVLSIGWDTWQRQAKVRKIAATAQ